MDKFDLLVSSRYVRELSLRNPILLLLVIAAVVVGLLYWFFGTEVGCGIRATGANRNMARAQGINTERNAVHRPHDIPTALSPSEARSSPSTRAAPPWTWAAAPSSSDLAAVIIGEVVLRPQLRRNFALEAALAASSARYIYYVVIQVVLRLGLNTNDLKLLTALIVALFLAIPLLEG